MKHYTNLITERATAILQYTTVLTLDGYFMKEGFVTAAAGLRLITKARADANMRYLYKGLQHKDPGRKEIYDGKVSWQALDKRRFRQCY